VSLRKRTRGNRKREELTYKKLRTGGENNDMDCITTPQEGVFEKIPGKGKKAEKSGIF